jgi:tricorn protease
VGIRPEGERRKINWGETNMRIALLLLGLIAGHAAIGADDDRTLLLRQPALSADHLAFVYAGDIWIAGRDGNQPRRLTSSAADEGRPVFSPDGSQIAFVANFEGNDDVYVIAADGGQPQRLTWHPADDRVTGWTPDGAAVTVVSNRETDHGRSGQLYHAAVAGGLPQKRMLARVFDGQYDGSGRRFAYIDFGPAYNGLYGGSAGWKGYRGGTAPAVRIMDMDAGSAVTIPGAGATNFSPFWLGGDVYFLSDREFDVFNVYRYDARTGDVTRLTDERTWEVRAASGHGTDIVYEAGGRLKRLDLASGDVGEIAIAIAPDLPQKRVQWKSATSTIQSADISATGKRAVITARGDVFTVPVEHGSTRNLSATPGVREYTALWSPDGERVAWLEDSLGGQTLVIRDQGGLGEPARYEIGPHFYELLAWGGGETPHLVLQDNHLGLHALAAGSSDLVRIATAARRDSVYVAVSPDGRWLAYTEDQPNYASALKLYEFATGQRISVASGDADAASPAFSRDGQYLFFAASTNAGPLQVGLNMTSRERPYRAGLYAAVLAADGKSPLLPRTGDEGDDEEAEAGGDGDDEESEASVTVRIDADGLDARIVGLPVAEDNYRSLAVGKDGRLYYVRAVQAGASVLPPDAEQAEGNALVRFDFDEREAADVLDGITDFGISEAGGHMLIERADGSLAVAEIGDEIEPEALDLGGVRLRIDPAAEWAQIFDEAWRMEREFFYADNLHGLDWQSIYDRYRPLVDHVGRREDLNALMVEMIAELQVGHNRVGGGDVYAGDSAATGLLGANFAIADGRYRVAHVYTGGAWNPFVAAPLATPGNAVREGEYILAIDGRELTAKDNIFDYLQGTAGKQVTLRVGPRTDGRRARDVVVEPVPSERALRLWDWIEDNRRRVDEATNGRVGYIYLPNTGDAGFTFFNRMFFSQVDKDALIIDERSNGGGQAANYITDVLSRAHLSGWRDREGLPWGTPAGAVHGPMVMLIDQDAGSGGDFLPYSFRQLGLGKLIGTRTWGGLIGIAHNPALVDGGYLTVPFFRFYDADGRWTIENEGVAPDIEAELDPIATNGGRDTQLERAIEEIVAELAAYESDIPQAPPLPAELGE